MKNFLNLVREKAEELNRIRPDKCLFAYGETYLKVAAVILKQHPKLDPATALSAASHAIYFARAIGRDHLEPVAKAMKRIPLKMIAGSDGNDAARKAKLDRKAGELARTQGAFNCLQNAGIRFVGELVQKTEADLMKVRYFGKRWIQEIKEDLARDGLCLEMDIGWWSPPDE